MRNLLTAAATLAALAVAPDCRARPAARPNIAGNPDMTGFAREVDTNRDGKMSRAEWQAKGLPAGPFKMFEKGRGYVTLKDFETHPAPPGIDLNGDGKLTVAEFKEFDRRGSAGHPPAGPAVKP